ncbi:MAG: hypothetical protein ABGY11_00870 [Candidatus Thioglobus sp.]
MELKSRVKVRERENSDETMSVHFTKLFNKNISFSGLDVEACRKWCHYLQNKEMMYRAKSFFSILQ